MYFIKINILLNLIIINKLIIQSDLFCVPIARTNVKIDFYNLILKKSIKLKFEFCLNFGIFEIF